MVRADAQQNRDRILEVARAALEKSADASLNQIAQQSGVGAGTLYRHFPNRESLVLAVYASVIDELSASVDQLLAELDPVDALRQWTRDLVRYSVIKHGLGDALTPGLTRQTVEATYEPVITAIRRLLAAGAADGVLRPDLDPDDILILMASLWRVPEGDDRELRSNRMLELLIDGWRPVAPT